MPVYLRKNTQYTPDSLQNFNPIDDDAADFIQDPDLVIDKLPQPFRLIDKIVTKLVEDAWDIIVKREGQRNAEASKIRPPKYTTDIQVQVHGLSKSLCNSQNGEYIFVGRPDGLAVILSKTNETVDEWKDDKMDIVEVTVQTIDGTHNILTTVDDMGIGRLFLFSEDNLYLMTSFNEPAANGESVPSADISKRDKGQTQAMSMMGSTKKEKPIITKCAASSNGDFVGVCFQNVQTQENWLEFFKVNKESLFKELENANNKFSKKHDQAHDDPTLEESTVDETATEPPTNASEPNSARDDGSEGRTDSPGSQKTGDKRSLKFTAPQSVLKIKPPSNIVGINHNAPINAQKSIDDSGDVVGAGTKHMLSHYHLELKKAVFELTRDQMLQYLPKDNKPSAKDPSFHFLFPGRMLPQGMDQSALQGQPTAVLVWWEGQYQVMTYSLIKPAGKEVEHKPEMVWPMSSSIVCSTITSNCKLLALALANNNVVIWDLQLGMVRRIVHVSDTSQIFKVHFLDPSLYDDSKVPTLGGSRPYKLGTNSYLLVVFNDGQLCKVSCGLNDNSPPEKLVSSMEDWENYTVVEPIIGLPELVVTCRKNGQVFIEDIMTGSIVLEISLPEPYFVFTPWQPVFAIGGKGSVLYIKGHSQPSTGNSSNNFSEPAEMVAGLQSVFVFKLRSVRTLDPYRKKKRNTENTYTVHTTLEQRTDILMQERISQQGIRTSRLKQRWTQLKEELELIRDLREKSQKKGAPRAAFVSAGY